MIDPIEASVESTPELSRLVEKYGWQRVWSVGESVLGYPPTWKPGLLEVLTLKSELEKL